MGASSTQLCPFKLPLLAGPHSLPNFIFRLYAVFAAYSAWYYCRYYLVSNVVNARIGFGVGAIT
ncbi:hypothetical protein BDQ94DRAFT_133537 [Aspergillus welwitschiae]|uniref:Uncharacterized protein n=1 Tax=Aspergillus welwitschiae TaxID=1341132 RepID=A0A3F3QKE0_9EURO|nr:hypothetical protein BDQ94DRAFT_133537 [Aspergillus welwitschiae]RDH39718.1 hypothetical protein BDQ94DRAFT_133537 [Aspergillus welwitschiae]